MFTAAALFASSLLLPAQAAQTRSSEIYRQEFRRQPERAHISTEFSDGAWIALLYASRFDTTDRGNRSAFDVVEVRLEELRTKIKSDGDWLFWYRLKSYNIANLLPTDLQGVIGGQLMPNANACRSQLMAALRAHMMNAIMPDCELVEWTPTTPTH